ncbi:hypothetical protein GPJ56_005088 [Histomonas meleagridis]|uniref:uncharacterized protein n=1 Tax=Histomonas meleagridis TaxID=135588 RepID=UPI003559EC90|nr:hypothetical protein GPJ56_005088 [Histomonas meleagridis]KAH0802605.1 hypothetical protein GO595_004654 [Histomonas meleagridis]
MAIQNENLPKQNRVLIHLNLISPAYQYIDKNLHDEVQNIIKCSIKLSLDCCHEDRKDESYEFLEEFLTDLNEAERLLFDYSYPYIRQFVASQDLAERQVAFLLIRSASIVFTFPQSIEYLLVVLSFGDVDDEIIVQSCCQTIEKFLNDHLETVIYLFNNVLQYLTNHMKYFCIFQTLDRVIVKCKMPIQSLSNIVSMLVNLLPRANVDQATTLLYCISNCLLVTTNIDENIYISLKPILTSACNLHPLYQSPILLTFGNLVKISPIGIAQDLSAIFELINKSMNSILDPSFRCAVICIQKLVEYLPLTVSNFITSEMLQKIIFTMNMEMPKSEEMQIEGNVYMFKRCKQSCSKCLFTIAREIPKFAEQFGSTLWEILCSKINPIYGPNSQVNGFDEQFYEGCILFRIGSKMFAENQCPLINIFPGMLNTINTSDNTKAAIATLKASCEIIKYASFDQIFWKGSPEKLIHVNLLLSDGIFCCAFPNQKYSQIPINLRRTIFQTLLAVIDRCGHSIIEFFDQIYKTISHEFFSTTKLNQSFFMHIFSKILYYCPELQKDLLETIYPSLVEALKQEEDYETQTNLFISLIFLIKTTGNVLGELAGYLLQLTTKFLNEDIQYLTDLFEACLGLWGTLIMNFGFEFDENSIKFIDMIQPKPNSELLPVFVEFLMFTLNKVGGDVVLRKLKYIFTMLFASRIDLISKIPLDVLKFALGALQQIQQNEVMEFCGYNESYVREIQSNLNRILKNLEEKK